MARAKILLVEGVDDKHVLIHVCRKHSIPDLDDIRVHEGAPDLLEGMSRQIEASTGEQDVIGVVIDANNDLTARWQAIRHRLIDAKYQDVPVKPSPSGTISEPPEDSPLPRVGAWIMPDNENPGELEDFLLSLVPEQDGLFDHAAKVVENLSEKRFSEKDKIKVIMHTWLAWQNSPGRPYGTAIAAGFLDASPPQANALVSWLGRLFYPTRPTT